tara:strand:- start:88 stop:474 length:387 start_codon:yes stop_codon:yes gene_type:complete
MNIIKLYREDNGQYSTSEARQDDVSGSYVQKTDYDELKLENDELKASISQLVHAMTVDIHKAGDNFRLQDALDKTTTQHLADIKADAVLELAKTDLGYSVETSDFSSEWVYSKDDVMDYAENLRKGEQ